MFDINKIETTLLTNWTSFVNYRLLLSFITDLAEKQTNKPVKIKKLTLTHFRPIQKGFYIWAEFETTNNKQGTSELVLSHDGELTHISTII